MATGAVTKDVVYPESDGMPMAESDLHRDVMTDLIERLKLRYADDPDTYVSGNLLVYYEEGNPHRVLAPDCLVAFGVQNRRRTIYKVWEEGGRYPAVVFEITSRSTEQQDLFGKFDTYQDVWRVREYFLFDPEEDYLDPSLLGYRRSRSELRPVKPVKGRLTSTALGITLEREGTHLLLRDAKTGKELPLPGERAAGVERKRRKAVKAKLDLAEVKLEQASKIIEQMKAEIDALRKRKS